VSRFRRFGQRDAWKGCSRTATIDLCINHAITDIEVLKTYAQGEGKRRPGGISKRGGKVLLLDFSSERLLPPTASTTISDKPFDTKLSRYLSQTR
jgi:hypothetical protein